MSKMIQLRNVPDALHRGLKARAAMARMSLSDYLLAEVKETANRSWSTSTPLPGARTARRSMIVLDASAAIDWFLQTPAGKHIEGRYDSSYIALAETLAAPLVTRDSRLASALGHEAMVEVY